MSQWVYWGCLRGIWGRDRLLTGAGGPQSLGHQWKAHLCWVWIWNALLRCMCSHPTVLLGVQEIFRSWVPIWGLSQHPCRGLWYPGHPAMRHAGFLHQRLPSKSPGWCLKHHGVGSPARRQNNFFLLLKFPQVVCYNNKCSLVIFLIESQLDVWGGIGW